MAISSSIFVNTRKFAVGELITLYQLDLTALGGAIYYFTNNIFQERIPIMFGGQTYTHLPIAMEGIDTSSNAGPAQPRLMLATSGGPITALIMGYKDLRGAKFYRIRTFAEFLDQKPDGAGGVIVNPGADPMATLPYDYFVVDRKVSSNNTMAEFQLVSPTDADGVMIPLRVVKKRYCDKIYRYNANGVFTYTNRSNPCPYAGTAYFDINNATTTAAGDRCSKTINGCFIRFGKATGLPFSGFPGVKGAGEPG